MLKTLAELFEYDVLLKTEKDIFFSCAVFHSQCTSLVSDSLK